MPAPPGLPENTLRRRLRRHSARLLRPGVVVSLLLGHALTALGLPLPRPVPAASAATPSPCGPRACGCLIAPGSPEPCCCSTGRKAAPMPEPALGAAAGGCCAAGAGRTAPDPARPHCARAPDEAPLPSPPPLSLSPGRCRGPGPAGLLSPEPALPPRPDTPRPAPPVPVAVLSPRDLAASLLPTLPPTPPPRLG